MRIAGGCTGFRGCRNKDQKLWPEATGICSQSGDQKSGMGGGGSVSRGSEAEPAQPLPPHVRPVSASHPGCSLPCSITPVRLSPHGGLPWVSVSCPSGLKKSPVTGLGHPNPACPILPCLHLPRPRVHTRSGTGTGPEDLSTVWGGRCAHCRGIVSLIPQGPAPISGSQLAKRLALRELCVHWLTTEESRDRRGPRPTAHSPCQQPPSVLLLHQRGGSALHSNTPNLVPGRSARIQPAVRSAPA